MPPTLNRKEKKWTPPGDIIKQHTLLPVRPTVLKDPDMLFKEVAKVTKRLGIYFDCAVNIQASIWWHTYADTEPKFGEPEWTVFVHGDNKNFHFKSWDELKLWARNHKKIKNMPTAGEKIGLQK